MAEIAADLHHSNEINTFNHLKQWIQENEGYVNENIEIFGEAHGYRGVRVKHKLETDFIPKGTLLAEIPMECVLSGATDFIDHNKSVSNWLRCLGSLLCAYAKNVSHTEKVNVAFPSSKSKEDKWLSFRPYIQSLPHEFDSILSWTDEEINFLQGTALLESIKQSGTSLKDVPQALMCTNELSQTKSCNRNMLCVIEEKFMSEIVQQHLKILQNCYNFEIDFEMFLWAINCISSRGFHDVQDSPSKRNNVNESCGDSSNNNKRKCMKHTDNDQYFGPFLIPLVDLFNHCPTKDKRKSTTLRRNSQSGNFYVEADRDLRNGEEILHSYGELNSQQLLKTYGFVDVHAVRSVLQRFLNGSITREPSSVNISPAVINRDDIISSCHDVAFGSTLEKNLLDEDIETWDPSECWTSKLKFVKDFIPEHISFNFTTNLNSDALTLCCVMFLPEDAFQEFLESPALLDETILEDPYLCYLVSEATLMAIRRKWELYRGGTINEDISHIQQFSESKESCIRREVFARIIIFEEKLCLATVESKMNHKLRLNS